MKIQIEIEATETACDRRGKKCVYLWENAGYCNEFRRTLLIGTDGRFCRCDECLASEVSDGTLSK